MHVINITLCYCYTINTLQYTQLSKYTMTTAHEISAARELIIEKEAT